MPHISPNAFPDQPRVPPWAYRWTRSAQLRTGSTQDQGISRAIARSVQRGWAQPPVSIGFLEPGSLDKERVNQRTTATVRRPNSHPVKELFS
jgi:hypothetical protein